MTNEEKFYNYLDKIKEKGRTELNNPIYHSPAEVIVSLAMEIYEKEINEKVDKLLKNKDNVIKLHRKTNPPVDSL